MSRVVLQGICRVFAGQITLAVVVAAAAAFALALLFIDAQFLSRNRSWPRKGTTTTAATATSMRRNKIATFYWGCWHSGKHAHAFGCRQPARLPPPAPPALPALECSATQNVFYAGSGFVRETVAKVLARNARGNTISALGPCGSFALLMLLALLLLPQLLLLLLWHRVWRLCGFGVCLAARDMTWQKAVWHKQRVFATVACLQNFRHSAAL